MTYSEKLKDQRWIDFREAFIRHKRQEHEENLCVCQDCGNERGPHHVHHRRYQAGREPWEYGFDDLRLLCESCHRHIHEVESVARELIISLPPHVMPEFQQLLSELAACQSNDGMRVKVALARAKNAVRSAFFKDQFDGLPKTIAMMEQDYMRSLE